MKENEQWSQLRQMLSNDSFFQRNRDLFTHHHCSIIVSTKLLITQESNVVKNSNVLKS